MHEVKPLVTVLMPCYNAEPFLREALDSIINQSYRNLEVLCINDGSTDKTPEILEEYAAKDKRIRIVHNEENIKLISTLNKGIDIANGKYIARMDADDISMLDRIELSVAYLEENKEVDLVSVNSINISERGNKINENNHRVFTPKGIFFSSFFYNPVGHPQTVSKRELLVNNRYLLEDKALHTEDYEIWARSLSKGSIFHNLDQALYQFRFNSQGVSRRFTSLQDENFIFQTNKYYNLYSNRNIPLQTSKVLANRIDKTINSKDLSLAIKEIKWFRNYFIQKEYILDKKVIKEISIIVKTHSFDIYYQAFKRTKGFTKVYSLFKLTTDLSIDLFQKEVRMYIFNKI